jgi:hypothetical protein
MGFLFDGYKKISEKAKEKSKGMREAAQDISKIAYDVSKNNPHAKQMRKEMRK